MAIKLSVVSAILRRECIKCFSVRTLLCISCKRTLINVSQIESTGSSCSGHAFMYLDLQYVLFPLCCPVLMLRQGSACTVRDFIVLEFCVRAG